MSHTIPNVSSFLNMLIPQRENIHTKQEISQTNTNSTNTNTDSLTLSPTLNALQQFLSMNDSTNNNGQDELNMSSLERLKQQGEMLASMLQMKLKNFESNLISSMKNAGINQTTPIDIKNDPNGLSIVNDIPDKQNIQNLLQNDNNLQNQFQDIARLTTLLDTVRQLNNNNNVQNNILSEAGAKYAQLAQQTTNNQQNNFRKNESDFILHILESNSSSMF
ncbi:MAG: hypothetical protein LBC74_03930 [Planctomycetaceae bacterium]|jgi:hypothetical protein|nr:hypothetical protein [Planctomycetaceae bacterium]